MKSVLLKCFMNPTAFLMSLTAQFSLTHWPKQLLHKNQFYVIVTGRHHIPYKDILPQCVGRSKLKTGCMYMVVFPWTITSYCPVDID